MHSPAKPAGQFLHHLGVASNQLRIIVRSDALRAYGLGLTEWLVLEGLANLHVATQRELTEPTKLDKVAVNRAVARLREAELISTRPNSSDGRSHLIELSDKGHATYCAASTAIGSMEERILDQFSSEEAIQIRSLIGKLKEVVAETASSLAVPKGAAATSPPAAYLERPSAVRYSLAM